MGIQGLDVKKLQMMLGHATIATTMEYVDSNFEALQSEYQNFGKITMTMVPKNKKLTIQKNRVMIRAVVDLRINRRFGDEGPANIGLVCLQNSILKSMERLALLTFSML